jgi:hypothetical protein
MAIVSEQGQVDGEREGAFSGPTQVAGQVGGEGGVDPPFDRVEVAQLGIQGGGEGLLAGGLGEPPAGLVDRGDACGGGEEDREDDLAGNLADGSESGAGCDD